MDASTRKEPTASTTNIETFDMSEQLPSVARADADGNGPPKRVRRPALSCVECRMRKVKCDRREPCGACIRIKSEKCTYRPSRPGVRGGTEKLPSTSGAGNVFMSGRSSSQSDLPGERSTGGTSAHAEFGASELVAVLLKENERLRSATNQAIGHEADIRPISEIVADLPGSFQKSKFFGQSHWMNALEPYEALGDKNTVVNPCTDRVEVNKSTELYKTVNELKTVGRILKTARVLLPTISPEVLRSLPPKTTCDVLLGGYLRTFEGVFRVLHVPSFMREYNGYWSDNVQAKPSVLLKILLVCAIGVPFYTGSDQPRLRVASAKWIQAAESWIAAPHAKSRLNMAGLQIQILIIVAKQACNVEGDHIWVPAGSVLRTAMYLGLHRDPSYFGKINTFHAEMRRRLWATVLELNAQSSLDMGMRPMITDEDYDTHPPSNVNDEDLREQEDSPLVVKPLDVCTDCSIQIAFAESLPIRLQIIRYINSLRFALSYSECLRLGKELSELCNAKTQIFTANLGNSSGVTPFHVKLLDSLVRRFVLGLHRPFFEKVNDNPQYHFSRKICLDASLAILAPATPPEADVEDDWIRLMHRAVGFFKSLILYAISTVYYELNTQIDEARDMASLKLPLTAKAGPQQPFVLPSQAQMLYDTIVWAYHKAVLRLRNGETNAKGVVFFACAIARVDALMSGADTDATVLKAAKSSIAEMRRILAEVYEQEHDEPIDLNSSRLRERDHGRGEGADDVTGQGAQTSTDRDFGIDQAGGLCSASNLDSGLDMDFGLESNSWSPVDLMDFNSQFLQDPEWFFNGSSWGGIGDDML